jgi:hypothetical protein
MADNSFDPSQSLTIAYQIHVNLSLIAIDGFDPLHTSTTDFSTALQVCKLNSVCMAHYCFHDQSFCIM